MSGFPLPPGVPIVDGRGCPTVYFLNYLTEGLFSGTVATAKLTVAGVNGSMTFVNGRLVSSRAAT